MKINDFKFQRKTQLSLVLVVLLMLSTLLMGQAWAQYKITKHSINNGGGVSTGQNFAVTGSIGQKEASNSSSGGGFKVTGGFWGEGTDNDLIFQNGFE